MNINEFWTTNHTWISILVGFVLTIAISSIRKLPFGLKAVIIPCLISFIVGISGFLIFSFVLLIIFYGGYYAIYSLGIVFAVNIAHAHSWHLAGWLWFILAIIWALPAKFINNFLTTMFILIFDHIVDHLGKFTWLIPKRIKSSIEMLRLYTLMGYE